MKEVLKVLIGINSKIVNVTEEMHNKTILSGVIDGYQAGWVMFLVDVIAYYLDHYLNCVLILLRKRLNACNSLQVLASSDLSIDLKYAENITLTAAVFEHLQLPRSHLEHTYGNL